MRSKNKKRLIKIILISIIPAIISNLLVGHLNYYPQIFLGSALFYFLPKALIQLVMVGGFYLLGKKALIALSLSMPNSYLLGASVVFTLFTYLLVKGKLKGLRGFKLKPGTPIMDQVDKIRAGASHYERGLAFEEFVCDTLNKLGYKAHTTSTLRKKGKLPASIQNGSGAGEQGVDIVAHKDGEVIAIQCKLYSKKVSNSAIQEIATALSLYKADRGVVITNQVFTQPARNLAQANGVELINRFKLEELIKQAS